MSNLHPSSVTDPPNAPRSQRIAESIAGDAIEAIWQHYWAFSINEPAVKRALVRVLAMGMSHGKPLEEPLTDVEVRTIDRLEGNTDWRKETIYADI